ncbi:MAG: phosphoribosyltransferase [Proteobacteria bacterium]|nr:phosphoribosyltransferase [Pseudomonadota bacterium]
MNKRFIAANDLLLDSFRLAVKIYEAGFRPDYLVGVWRGGSAVGIAVQEGLENFGVKTDHIAIRTSYDGPDSYTRRTGGTAGIRVHGLQYLLENICAEDSLLIVDDVYSTGSSVNALIEQLAAKTRRNQPHDIRVAAVWYRPTARTIKPPDFYLHEIDDWLVLPHELTGLGVEEIKQHKPGLAPILDELASFLPTNN